MSALSSFKRAMNRTMGFQETRIGRRRLPSWSIEARKYRFSEPYSFGPIEFKLAPHPVKTGTPPGHRYWNRRRLREAKTIADRVRLHAEREEQERRMG